MLLRNIHIMNQNFVFYFSQNQTIMHASEVSRCLENDSSVQEERYGYCTE